MQMRDQPNRRARQHEVILRPIRVGRLGAPLAGARVDQIHAIVAGHEAEGINGMQ
jgi:hypothetical protein